MANSRRSRATQPVSPSSKRRRTLPMFFRVGSLDACSTSSPSSTKYTRHESHSRNSCTKSTISCSTSSRSISRVINRLTRWNRRSCCSALSKRASSSRVRDTAFIITEIPKQLSLLSDETHSAAALELTTTLASFRKGHKSPCLILSSHWSYYSPSSLDQR